MNGEGVSTTSGRLEIFSEGIWGMVCDENLETGRAQDITDDVICLLLGHTDGGMVSRNIWRHHTGAIIDWDAPIWLTCIRCQGDENNLYDCLYEVGDEAVENRRRR